LFHIFKIDKPFGFISPGEFINKPLNGNSWNNGSQYYHEISMFMNPQNIYENRTKKNTSAGIATAFLPILTLLKKKK